MDLQSALVLSILRQWRSFEWTIQGFGFARTKLANVGRIHVWDSRLRVPLVSDVHAHPWPLRSTIISGELINQRFKVNPAERWGMPYMQSAIATGEGGGLIGEPQLVKLYGERPEFYRAGDTYEQAPEEVHRSIPMDGTVTLIERPMGPPLQETLVYWPEGTQWVSAEPRAPNDRYGHELEPIISHALARWAPASAFGPQPVVDLRGPL
jgi:hypothetical protein